MSTSGSHSPDERNTGDGEKHSPDTEPDSPYLLSADGKPTPKAGLPDWLNHFNKKDLQTLFKCSIAVWIATIFIFIKPVANALGTATFFGPLVLFFVPPSGIVFIHVMAGLTMILGMCLGWAWGIISMKAALATRPAAQTQARLALLGATAQANVPNAEQASGQSAYTQVLIFEGFMLDTRVVITYFCMIGLFIYLVARLRVAAPKLVLLQIFAIIVSDVFLTTGPLLPSFQGAIPQVLVKPAALAVAIGMACNIIFFPQSTSYIVLEGMEGLVAPIEGLLQACLISFKKPTSRFDIEKLQATCAKVIAASQSIESGLGFINLDVSYGRWNPEDIKTLAEPLRQLTISFLALLQFQVHRIEARSKIDELSQYGDLLRDGEQSQSTHGHHQLAHALDMRSRFYTPQAEQSVENSLRALFTSSGGLLTTSGAAVDAIVDAVHHVNTRRWMKKPTAQECEEIAVKHEAILKRLKADREEFAALTTEHLLGPHSHLFDRDGKLVHPGGDNSSPLHGLLLGMIFEEKLLDVAEALEGVLAQVVQLERHRVKTRMWLPTGLRHAGAYLFGKSPTPGTPLAGEAPRPKKSESSKEGKKSKRSKGKQGTQEQLDSLRFRQGSKRSATSKAILAIFHWFSSSEGMYALIVLVVTIALGLPAVLRSSAGFYYREKGLWAMIMSQTGLVVYASEFVYGFITRVIGTVIGGILGMLIWYIGAGRGPGNSYGMAAIMALAIVGIMWARLFAPPALLQAVMLVAATSLLVMAYSWTDTHQPTYGNPGVGYSVFWRRTLLVLIGFTAAAIVTFLPRPPSAARHNCKVISGILRTDKDLYALLISSWRNPHDDLSAVAEKNAIQYAETLAGLIGPIALLRFEFSSSNFGSENLGKVVDLCITMNESLAQLLIFSAKLPQHLKDRFARLTGALDEAFVGELMAVITLVEQALKTGDPLPALLPVPLVARSARISRNIGTNEEWGRHALTVDMVRDEGFRKYCVVLSAFVQLLGAIDELVLVVKEAVGETQMVDLEDGERGSLLHGSKDE